MDIICGSCKTPHSSKDMIALCTRCCTDIGNGSQATERKNPVGSAPTAGSATKRLMSADEYLTEVELDGSTNIGFLRRHDWYRIMESYAKYRADFGK